MDKTEAVKALKALAHCYKTKCSECEFSGRIPGRPRSCGLPDDDEIMEGVIEYIVAQQKELDQLKEHEAVVRCKDCKHGHKCLNGRREPMVKCELFLDGWLHDFDWFCADGERMDAE